jgi:benzoyl-CoA reductase subunit C
VDRFQPLIATLENEAVQEAKAAGGLVLGYACLFTPVEVMDAAGIFPYRIKALGNSDTDLADARLSRFNCSFCRSCLQLGLDGSFDFLDGLVESNGCDQLRGMFENWQYARPQPFFHYVRAPHRVIDEALDHYLMELGRYRDAIQELTGVELTDERLRDAMARQGRIRKSLFALWAHREADPSTLSGADALRVMIAEGSVPPARFEELLAQLLADLDAGRVTSTAPPTRARLLFGGAATDEIEFVEEMEQLGGRVVADTMCFGSRAFWATRDADGAGDPLRLLADQYLRQSLCPRMYEDFDRRLRFILDAVKRAKVDGVVLVHNKFCDVHGIDNALLRIRLEERGVPVLSLEKEYGAVADRGRVRTRVQAFLERIGGTR